MLRNSLLFFLLIAICLPEIKGQAQVKTCPVIPLPEKTVRMSGNFFLTPQTVIYCTDHLARQDVKWFNERMEKYYGYKLSLVDMKPEKGNCIELSADPSNGKNNERYELEINSDRIFIRANSTGSGFFYALQSLVQLMPVPVMKDLKKAPAKTFAIPCYSISDAPRFNYRGMHLDVCRHFFGIEFIKRYLDLLAMYKMNVFHWHLTEDQGWRIEIKKYPELTRTGAWRKGTMVGKYSDNKYDTFRYGGFYTQEQIREVVAYAASLHITVIPEIEMPGHSQAAVAAYPWLSCNGKQLEVARGWGVFDDVYCTKDSVFNFLQDVLDEVCALFPGNYIHIGGDECPKTRWKTCAQCQKRIKELGLKDEHELQSYFIQRMEKFLNGKGKQIIGWDEILEGGLAPNATVMSWRGTQGGIDAARQQHDVVMTPGKPCYFDHYQSKNKAAEPLAIGGYNPVDSVYFYEPLPAVLNEEEARHILGAQGNVWTEYILSERHVEYMTVPRMSALSEVLWSPKDKRDLKNFKTRMQGHRKLLDLLQVNYAKHFFN